MCVCAPVCVSVCVSSIIHCIEPKYWLIITAQHKLNMCYPNSSKSKGFHLLLNFHSCFIWCPENPNNSWIFNEQLQFAIPDFHFQKKIASRTESHAAFDFSFVILQTFVPKRGRGMTWFKHCSFNFVGTNERFRIAQSLQFTLKEKNPQTTNINNIHFAIEIRSIFMIGFQIQTKDFTTRIRLVIIHGKMTFSQ